MTTDKENDFWLDFCGNTLEENAAERNAGIAFTTIENVEPLDDQFGVVGPLAVPPQLREALFGQFDATGGRDVVPLHTYAVLDAARVPGLPEVLEASGLAHACMFQGEAAVDLRDVAPWIVQLEEGHDFTRRLFSQGDGPRHLWDAESGIFLRSQGSLDDVRKHLRKFTKVRDHSSKWYYVRFYDPKAATTFLDQTSYWNALLSFHSPQRLILRVSEKTWLEMRTGPRRVSRTEFDFDLERRKEFERRLKSNARLTVESLAIPPDKAREAEEAAQYCMSRMLAYGFKNTRHLRIMAAWELTFGARYEEYDPSGELISICHDNAPALRRFKRFAKRMDAVRFKQRTW